MNDMIPVPAARFEITERDRMAAFHEDNLALSELVRVIHTKAMAGDLAAGSLEVRIRERRAAMWGYDSPQRFDMVQVSEVKRPNSTRVIDAAINRVIEQMPPKRRALFERLRQYGGDIEQFIESAPELASDCTSVPDDQAK